MGLSVMCSSTSFAEEASSVSYVEHLVRQSFTLRLSEKRYWHLLLHYRTGILGGVKSEVDDPGFFFAKDGKTNPKSELEATLRHFFSGEVVGRSEQVARCAFIARYHWLKDQLSIDEAQLPLQECSRFTKWYEEFQAESVTLIFASAFMNNPSSMFGHTFLRIDQANQTEQTRILAYTINYSADVPPNTGIAFAVKGLTGGYKGYFSTVPYYGKVREYRDLENRDIWEYRLNFNESQVRQLLMHTWEMGNAYFNYFFFDENCSYHLLSLLEVADPNLHLTDELLYSTFPVETVRLMSAVPGLVEKVTYRPSRSTTIKRKWENFSHKDKELFHALRKDSSRVTSSEFTMEKPEDQVVILDLVSDYLQYQKERDDEHPEEYTKPNREILVARSHIHQASKPEPILPFTSSPEFGHRPTRLSIGGGWREDEFFEEFALRGGYHDLLDPDPGYIQGAQIELLGFSLRHYEKSEQVRLEEFTFVNIVSLSPVDGLFQTPSWKINVGMNTEKTNSCRLCSNGNFNGGIGGTGTLPGPINALYFGFAEIDANVSGGFQDHHRVGGGGTVGIVAPLTEEWKVLLTSTFLQYPLGERSDDFRVSVGQRYSFSQNWAARLTYDHRDNDNEVGFSLQTFF